ncbi:hypothetical protein ACPUEJ_21735 [Vibrio tubiashii]|uniref:hypothetical protein n=1 Tax=Vibrio tubiashii TaxID=29498 RepID=UPI003CE4A765
MANKFGILTLHGMGNQEDTYHVKFISRVAKELGVDKESIPVESVYYHTQMQENQEAMWKRMTAGHDLDVRKTRQFMLFSFSDAANIQDYSTPESLGSVVTKCVHDKFNTLLEEIDSDGVVVIVAQSLGNQVFSNYVWDIQNKKGIFRPGGEDAEAAREKLKRVRIWFSTGNNMPLFVSGLHQDSIKSIKKPSDDFEWWNFFDVDDALGWPLKPMEGGYTNALNITDFEINTGMTLLSHKYYWKDRDFIEPLCDKLRTL